MSVFFFFFTVTATTEIYTLSLHDALPISVRAQEVSIEELLKEVATIHSEKGLRTASVGFAPIPVDAKDHSADRKSTRLNSSHVVISYAVFCLKKKKEKQINFSVILGLH